MKETRKIESFMAVDEDGNEHEIILWQEFIIERTRKRTSECPGLKEYTMDNEHINTEDEIHFTTKWGKKLTKKKNEVKS